MATELTAYNPHTYAANVGKVNFNPRDGDYYVAQATLALAYEQQTANLIAWVNSGKSYVRDTQQLITEINKRLGLNE